MQITTETITTYLFATGLLALIVFVTYIIGRFLQSFVSYISNKTGFSDWLANFNIGKAIKRSGYSVGDFFGKVAMWVVFVYGILMGVVAWFGIIGYTEMEMYFLNIIDKYLLGFVKAFVIVIIGFVLTDLFVSYIKKSEDEIEEMRTLKPVSEYLRILFYIAVLLFALDVGGIGVQTLAEVIIPIIWGLIAIMVIATAGRILSDIIAKKQ